MFRFGFGAFLEDEERVVRVFRRPFFFVFRSVILRALLWGIIIGLLWFFYPAYNLDLSRNLSFDLRYLWIGLSIIALWHVLTPVFFWYVNAIVMTNEGLLIIEWPRFFERRATRIDFRNLDEITIEKKGVKAFLLNYGNIIFSKVNGGEEIVFKNINAPGRVARMIEEYKESQLEALRITEEQTLKELITSMVLRHAREEGGIKQKERPPKEERKEEKASRWHLFVNKFFVRPKKQAPLIVEKELDDTGGIDIELSESSSKDT